MWVYRVNPIQLFRHYSRSFKRLSFSVRFSGKRNKSTIAYRANSLRLSQNYSPIIVHLKGYYSWSDSPTNGINIHAISPSLHRPWLYWTVSSHLSELNARVISGGKVDRTTLYVCVYVYTSGLAAYPVRLRPPRVETHAGTAGAPCEAAPSFSLSFRALGPTMEVHRAAVPTHRVATLSSNDFFDATRRAHFWHSL